MFASWPKPKQVLYRIMGPIVAPPERRYFTRQPTDCDQTFQPNDGILPGNRQTDGILPGIREDEVEENYDWCEGYFMDRNTEPEKDPIVVLPIIERPRRSLIEIADACGNSWPLEGFSKCAQQRSNFSRSSALAMVVKSRMASWPGFPNSDPILDMVKSCVPELDRESLRDVRTTILEMQTQGDIHFSLKYMAMSDTQMVRAFAREAKRSLTGRYYVGITENPVRRLRMHADAHMPFMYMLIVRVAFTSSETASWEKLAIQHFREQLGFLALLNVGDGGERASGGIPHYGYILRCR